MKNKVEVIKVQKTLLEKKANDKNRRIVAGQVYDMPSEKAYPRISYANRVVEARYYTVIFLDI